eukprot:SAG22_NODE_131_length_18561_cov_10.941387_10_plen_58_part_00
MLLRSGGGGGGGVGFRVWVAFCFGVTLSPSDEVGFVDVEAAVIVDAAHTIENPVGGG